MAFTRINERFVKDLRTRIFSRLCELSTSFHSSKKTGVLLNRLISDTRQFDELFKGVITSWIIAPFCLLAILIVMATINPYLTIVSLAPAPLIYFCMWWFVRLLRGRLEESKEKEEEISSFAFENLSGVATVQALLAQKQSVSKFENMLGEHYKLKEDLAKITSRYYPILGFLSSSAVIIMLLYGGSLSIGGNITGGQLVAFMAYLAYLYVPIMNVTRANYMLQSLKVLLKGIEEILDSKEIVRSGTVDTVSKNPVLVMDEVGFSYDKKTPVLNGASAEFKPGECIGITGQTGEGKTTIAMMLIRLFDTDSGKIFLDGRDIREFKLDTLRKTVRLVMQDDVLFSGTVMDNLLYASDHTPVTEVKETCDKLTISKFVSKMPKEYDTLVGEKGYRLSYGEKQRLCIARAILSRPDVLILDEATSGLDKSTERDLINGVFDVMNGKTIILISHRESVMNRVNKIYNLANGNLSVSAEDHDFSRV